MNFRSDINSLRAIAVIMVVLFHFNVTGFLGGFVGVDIFFVISGYLMTKIIFSQMEAGTFSLKGFYLARARRIVPALSVLCTAVLLLGYFLLSPNDYELLGKHAYSSILFVSNFVYARDTGYFATASESKWLLHTWSLSVEWQFYLLFPVLIIALKKVLALKEISVVLIILVICSFIFSIYLSMTNHSAAFFLLPARVWEMLLGGLLFIYPLKCNPHLQRLLELTGISLIICSVLYFTPDTIWPGYLALVPTLGAALIILSANQSSLFSRNKLLAWFGKTSYSIYLWHWPIVVAIHYFDLKNNAYALIGGIALSVLCGYLSFRYIESTTRKVTKVVRPQGSDNKKDDLANSKVLPLFIICALFAVIIKVTDGLPSRVPEAVLIADAERNNKNPYSKSCNVSHRTKLESPECVFGENKDVIKAIVLGDSHSNTLINTIADSITDKSGGVVFMGANACHAPINIQHINFKQCGLYNQWVLKHLGNSEKYQGVPVIIVNRAMSFNGDYTKMSINGFNQGSKDFQQAYSTEYQAEICRLSQQRKVYLTLPIPVMPVDVPLYLGKKMMLEDNVPDVMLPSNEYYAQNKQVLNLQKQVSDNCNVSLLDPRPFLCPKGLCIGSKQGRPLYHDDNHLSEYGNDYLLPMFSTIWQSKRNLD